MTQTSSVSYLKSAELGAVASLTAVCTCAIPMTFESLSGLSAAEQFDFVSDTFCFSGKVWDMNVFQIFFYAQHNLLNQGFVPFMHLQSNLCVGATQTDFSLYECQNYDESVVLTICTVYVTVHVRISCLSTYLGSGGKENWPA